MQPPLSLADIEVSHRLGKVAVATTTNHDTDLGKKNIRYRGAQIWNYLLDLGINSETSFLYEILPEENMSTFSRTMRYDYVYHMYLY